MVCENFQAPQQIELNRDTGHCATTCAIFLVTIHLKQIDKDAVKGN